MTLQQAFEVALQHHGAGRLAEAEALYRQILQVEPRHPDALHVLGVIAHQVGRHPIAVDLIHQAIALAPGVPDYHSNLGEACRAVGRLEEAIAAYRQAIALKPGYPEAHYNLGNALQDKGQPAEAIAAYRRAIALRPHYPHALCNLGTALRDQGQLDEAVAAYRQAIALQPDIPEAHSNLGRALIDRGQPDEAIAACRRAIALQPAFPEAHNNLGNALIEEGQLDEAIAALRQAIALQPDYPEAHNNLGNALQNKGQPDEAIAAYRQAIALRPESPEAHSGLGGALAAGRLDETITHDRRALDLHPGHSDIHSNLLLTLHYHPHLDAQAIAEEHRSWNRQHAEPLRRFILPHANDRDPERRLRIGYVSPDLRSHAVAPMVLPLLACHDRTQFQLYCYAQVARPDAVTERFRSHADQWRSTVGVSDEEVARRIREDQIDLLVDLAGHTAGSRLLVFARKPAPVQVTRQGYPDTTGMTTMDYRITDAYADPPGLSDTLHSERLIRLPQTNWIYAPPGDCPAPMERPDGAPFTFGCFNNFAKVTEPMLRVWARILAAVPGSRLLLKAKSLASPDVRQRVRGLLREEGISPNQVELLETCRSEREHLALYHQVTVALDPFPYHGTTTTCEALWMGVPVITLAGRTHVSRVGVSLLTNLGLPELIAESPEAYVQLAVDLARDLPRLRDLHSTLRERMEASSLLDAPRFARDIEAAYRQMWRQWCVQEK